MLGRLRVVHYLNQFFAGIGGEEAAGVPPQLITGAVGPGRLLQTQLGDVAKVVATVACGDNYFSEHPEQATEAIVALVREQRPDLLVAGPAFQGGRYGVACVGACAAVSRALSIPVVTGMDPENPALAERAPSVFIVPSGPSAVAMAQTMGRLVPLALKLLRHEPIGDPAAEGYFARGLRRNVVAGETAAQRSVALLLAKLRGEHYATEVPLPTVDPVPAPPLHKPLAECTVALVSEGGVVPKGNPDGLKSARADAWFRYSIRGLDDLAPEAFEAIHSGYDTSIAKADPDRVVPLDAMRALERAGVIGRLADDFWSTTGNVTTVANAIRFGQEIAADLAARGVDVVVLTAT